VAVTRGTRRRLEPGALLWQEGDPPGEVALLLEGELEIVQSSPTGEVVVVNVARAGEWLGEMSCLDGRPHSATVRSRGASAVQRLSAAEFRAWLQEDPQRWSELFDRQSQRVRTLTQQMARLGFEPVRTRVARLLSELGQDGQDLSMTHQELAERIATTRESVSKALGGLAKEGLIRLSRGRITVLKRAALVGISRVQA